MNRIILAVVAVLCLLVSWGCASRGRETFRPAMLGPNQAVMYVFRQDERMMRSAPISVFVDQEFRGELRPGEHLVHVARPGEYLIRVEGASASMVTEVRVAAGNVLYHAVRMERRQRPTIQEVEPDLARRLIAGTRRIESPEPTGASGQTPRQSVSR